MKTYINTAQITSIRRFDKRINQEFTLHPEKTIPATIFGKPEIIPAYVSSIFYVFDDKRLSLKEFLDKYSDEIYEENGELYDYPYLVIRMSDGEKWTEIFESVKDLEEFLNNEILRKIHTIVV